MAFGFPAYHTECYSPASTTNVQDAVLQTISKLGWSIRQEREDGIIASTGMNLRSWGEKVLIDFLGDNSISVTSQCALPTQCLDWGKNRANVTKFIMELGSHE